MTFNKACIKTLEEVLHRPTTEREKADFMLRIEQRVDGFIETQAKLFTMDILMPEILENVRTRIHNREKVRGNGNF
ncbi:hypothetical protein KKH23_07435 [Patescibacteria group bacterium]|nr:hypothetical protein [Patescibacteria group bacterium]